MVLVLGNSLEYAYQVLRTNVINGILRLFSGFQYIHQNTKFQQVYNKIEKIQKWDHRDYMDYQLIIQLVDCTY